MYAIDSIAIHSVTDDDDIVMGGASCRAQKVGDGICNSVRST
jgi:hypothetical protein